MREKKPDKPFKDWLYEEVGDTFGITRKFKSALFDHFATLQLAENHPKREDIEELRLLAFEYIDSWNEDEYKFMFISRFIGLVHFVSPYYKVFTQRMMQVKYDNDSKMTEGIVEFMLAKGIQSPKKPHFFLHEYKPESPPLSPQIGGIKGGDPLGQLLIAMVASQKLNQDEKPIYGIYVNGRNWFLVVLEGKEYVVSEPYSITGEAIFALFAVLDYFKNLMDSLYKQP